MQDLDLELTKILELLLDVKIKPGDEVKMNNPASWDSYKHIEIIMSLEQQFNVSFEPQDIPLLTSKKAILEKLSSLLNRDV